MKKLYPMYGRELHNICEVYVKDGIIIKDRRGDFRTNPHNSENIVIEYNGCIKIMITPELKEHVEEVIKQWSKYNRDIVEKIEIYTKDNK